MEFCRSRTRSTPVTNSRASCAPDGKHVIDRRWRHRFRLRRHLDLPRRPSVRPVQGHADAARAGEQAAGLAHTGRSSCAPAPSHDESAEKGILKRSSRLSTKEFNGMAVDRPQDRARDEGTASWFEVLTEDTRPIWCCWRWLQLVASRNSRKDLAVTLARRSLSAVTRPVRRRRHAPRLRWWWAQGAARGSTSS